MLVRGEGGKFEPKPVKIGITDFRKTEIVEGLSVGDTVWIQDESAAGKPGSLMGGPPGGGKGGGR